MIDLKNKTPNILVIGDLMIDHYLWGSSEKISPEAPVQIININSENLLLGGAGNVIRNLKELGAKVDVLSVIGECRISKDINNLLNEINVDTQYLVSQKNRLASKKTRLMASKQQVVRYDQESIEDISIESENTMLNFYERIVENYDCILLSDYGKGILTENLTKSLIKIANLNKIKILVDPKGLDFSKYKDAYLLTPNIKEASKATQIEINNQKNLELAIKKLKSKCNLEVSLITLSEDGIAVFENQLNIYPTLAKEVFDVTGAGDTILASLGYALGCSCSIHEAVKFSNTVAGIVVGKIGSATATFDEIAKFEKSYSVSNEDQIKTFNEISEITKRLKNEGKKIVFTNGCFDILHAGHVKYLNKSKCLGDVLIVGLNSNQSVKSIKGSDRPINDEMDRAIILSSLKAIDFVVIFNEDNPNNLIKKIKPNVLVKGSDYLGKTVIGSDIADEVRYIDFIEGKSTTATIKKIKEPL